MAALQDNQKLLVSLNLFSKIYLFLCLFAYITICW